MAISFKVLVENKNKSNFLMQTQRSVIYLNLSPLHHTPVITVTPPRWFQALLIESINFSFTGFEHEAPISVPDFCCLRLDLHHDGQKPITKIK